MKLHLPAAVLLLATAIAVAPLHAHASDGGPRLAVATTARPLTVGNFNLLLGAEPGVLFASGANVYQVLLPMKFGITDELELFAGPIFQTVDPNLHDPAIGALLRLIHGGPLELGFRAGADLSLFGQVKSAGLQLGVPLRIHAGNILALDVGAHALVGLLPATTIGLSVPAGVTVNLGDSLYVGVGGEFRLPSFSDVATYSLPVSALLGYTIASGDRPFLDLGLRAGLPDLKSTANLSMAATARIYFYL
ncbi:MAG TPA: hypothetical protein VIG99_32155 [Myxococcaceae bacterium]